MEALKKGGILASLVQPPSEREGERVRRSRCVRLESTKWQSTGRNFRAD